MTPLTKTPEQLLRRYQQGRITNQGMVLELLTLTGKRRLLKLLEALPTDLLVELKVFVENYRPEMKVFRGPRPRAQAIRFVQEWLSRTNQTV